jgi:hypothetical protein
MMDLHPIVMTFLHQEIGFRNIIKIILTVKRIFDTNLKMLLGQLHGRSGISTKSMEYRGIEPYWEKSLESPLSYLPSYFSSRLTSSTIIS